MKIFVELSDAEKAALRRIQEHPDFYAATDPNVTLDNDFYTAPTEGDMEGYFHRKLFLLLIDECDTPGEVHYEFEDALIECFNLIGADQEMYDAFEIDDLSESEDQEFESEGYDAATPGTGTAPKRKKGRAVETAYDDDFTFLDNDTDITGGSG